MISRLTVLYDETCALCVRCRAWLSEQDALVPLEFLGCHTKEARERFAEVPWLGSELVIVSDEGDVWAGPAAFIMALWALREWREWSYRLSTPALAPLATRFFHAISRRRARIAALFEPVTCDAGACRVRPSYR